MKRSEEPFLPTPHGSTAPTARSSHDLKAWYYGVATACGAGLGAYTMYREPSRAEQNKPYVFIVIALFGVVTLYHAWQGSREAQARDVIAAPPDPVVDAGEACVLYGNARVLVRLGLLSLALGPIMYLLLEGMTRWLGLGLVSVAALGNLWRAWRTPQGPVVVIDRSGITDARSEAGRIDWSNVERVYVQRVYGSPFLCLALRNSRRVRGASRIRRWMGAGDITISFVGLYPGPDEAERFLRRLRPDFFTQTY